MLMQGFPLHRLQLSGLSDQDTRLFVYDDSSRCYGCQEIGDLAGNSMALRCVAASWIIALKALGSTGLFSRKHLLLNTARLATLMRSTSSAATSNRTFGNCGVC